MITSQSGNGRKGRFMLSTEYLEADMILSPPLVNYPPRFGN